MKEQHDQDPDPRYDLWEFLDANGFKLPLDDDLNSVIHLALRAADDDSIRLASLVRAETIKVIAEVDESGKVSEELVCPLYRFSFRGEAFAVCHLASGNFVVVHGKTGIRAIKPGVWHDSAESAVNSAVEAMSAVREDVFKDEISKHPVINPL